MKYLFSSVGIVVLVICNSYSALAQTEVTLLAPRPIQPELEKLVAGFESSTSYKVKATWGSGLGTKEQVAKGEAADVSVMFAPFPEALASGNIVPTSGKTLARLILGLAVKKGAPRPDISTPDAVRRTLLAAKSLVTVDPAQGSVGVSAMSVLQKLGITDQVKSKLKFVQNGGLVQTSVANGEVEIALGPYIGDIENPGLDVAGALPREVSTPTDFAGYISTSAKDSAGAKALLDYLSSAAAAQVYRAARMERLDENLCCLPGLCRDKPCAHDGVRSERRRTAVPGGSVLAEAIAEQLVPRTGGRDCHGQVRSHLGRPPAGVADEKATRGTGSVYGLAFSPDENQKFIYMIDGMNGEIRIVDRASKQILASFGRNGLQAGQFTSLHNITVDKQGNIYTAEVGTGQRVQKFRRMDLQN